MAVAKESKRLLTLSAVLICSLSLLNWGATSLAGESPTVDPLPVEQPVVRGEDIGAPGLDWLPKANNSAMLLTLGVSFLGLATVVRRVP